MIYMFGEVKKEAGLAFSHDNFKVVKKVVGKDEKIPSHNHEEEIIIFSVLK